MSFQAYFDNEATGSQWVPDFTKGQVRDLRPRWALEGIGLPYRERLFRALDPRPDAYYQKLPWRSGAGDD
jgi:glutathione S-transferase